MRILLLVTAFNSLTQRVYVELADAGHDLAVGVVHDANDMAAAVESFPPDVIVAPYLKSVIPESIWRTHTCLIVHPGIRGDRGPSSLDWAILRGERTGVLRCCKPLPNSMSARSGPIVSFRCAVRPRARFIATRWLTPQPRPSLRCP
jgi:hypothetical protein